jgi:hypothetical protein
MSTPYFSIPQQARYTCHRRPKIRTAAASPWPAGRVRQRPAESHEGIGDDVVVTDWPARPAIVTFECLVPGGNVAVETDGNESVLVNTVGSYRGSRWINIHENTRTRALLITAQGPWRLDVADLDSLPPSGRCAAGAGDSVVYLSEEITEATISHQGRGNFIVEVAGAADEPIDLAVNEIGAFRGTVPLAGPALVQVASAGRWRIDGH